MKLIITTLLACASMCSAADIYVVVNENNSIDSLSRKQIVDIYMGRKKSFPNRISALPIDNNKASNDTKKAFYKHMTGKSLPQISAYWAKLHFSGRHSPPPEEDNIESLLNTLNTEENALIYIDSDDYDGTSGKVIYTIKQ